MNKIKCIKVALILLIPFISIIAIIEFRHMIIPTNKEIIKNIILNKGYKTLAEVSVCNELQNQNEDVKLYYKRNVGHRIDFINLNISKIYSENNIEVKENEYVYSIDREKNDIYAFLFVEKLLQKDVEYIKEKSEEWGDIKYIEIMVNIDSDNSNFSKAKVYINKKERKPIVTKIYDKEGKERIIIVYKKFSYSKKINSKQFKYDKDGASNMAPV
ncbi:hypothetical protein KQI77_09310 [Clostridium sp. MSJ-8]|uniref:germination lipoprotein GerS-related protein n=1 Tax=Clostridium sp. MSJ-8 TaxID=2841510 RepID=UPI001C0E9EBA|nr:germination lipoprotein GerS-related protein [Clostridium sp. MSJ-8]MBU5488332.1 hypothetical protein [Clostridium sp. MSJ-8]